MSQLYDVEITAILDHLIPTRSVICRRRPSDPWFDQDCRLSKRLVRLLERKSRRTDPADVCAATAAAAAWTAERPSTPLVAAAQERGVLTCDNPGQIRGQTVDDGR